MTRHESNHAKTLSFTKDLTNDNSDELQMTEDLSDTVANDSDGTQWSH